MTPSTTASRPAGARPAEHSKYVGPTQVDSSGTSGVVQVMGRTSTASGDLAPVLRRPSDAYQIPIRFSGQGGDYFRIWIVNLLLTILTLSLYRPWARVRMLRYFYGQTRIEGFPLDFHGEPRKMLRGHILVSILFLGYALAGQFNPVAQLIATGAVVLLAPALWRASMQFRLAHTSWRGMRFGFTGTLRGVYFVFAAPLIALAVLGGLFGVLSATGSHGAANVVLAVGAVVVVCMLPLFLWLLKSYQQDNLVYAELRAELRTGPGSFYGVFLRTIGVALLVGIAVAAVVSTIAFLVALVVGGMASSGAKMPSLSPALLAGLGVFAGVAYVLLLLVTYMPVIAYHQSRMQNLVWSRTGSRVFRFKSELSARSLTWLLIKNALLTIVTLGLYFPWAHVAVTRARLQAITLVSRTSLDELVNLAQARPGDVAGDAAGDVMGLDFGM